MEKQRVKYRLQFFGGRGASDTASLGRGKPKNINIISETDVWSIRNKPGNAEFVDEINKGVGRIESDFPGVMDSVNSVNAAELGGADRLMTLGYYASGAGVSINQNFTDIDTMNKAYDNAVRSKYHPSRGDVSGTQAVALHEMGHALTDFYGKEFHISGDLDTVAERIVRNAHGVSGAKGGTTRFARQISKYATESWAECVAEAVADYYCNGSKAHANSRAIMTELGHIYDR